MTDRSDHKVQDELRKSIEIKQQKEARKKEKSRREFEQQIGVDGTVPSPTVSSHDLCEGEKMVMESNESITSIPSLHHPSLPIVSPSSIHSFHLISLPPIDECELPSLSDVTSSP